MSNHNGLKRDTFGGLTVFGHALLIMAIAAAIGLLWTSVAAFQTERETAYQQSQKPCAGATSIECQEVAIATRSALAAERAADFSAQQLWLNLIGIVGLGATVAFAGLAWRAAKKSAEAADHTLRVSHRAYIALGDQRVGFRINSVVDGVRSDYVSVDFAIQNRGLSPALQCELKCSICEVPYGADHNFPRGRRPGRIEAIPKEAIYFSTTQYIDFETMARCFRREISIYLRVEISYLDVFDASTQRETSAVWSMHNAKHPDDWPRDVTAAALLNFVLVASNAT